MKIDIVSPFFPPIVGGAESYTHGVAVGMAKKGHQVTVHTSAYNPVSGEKYQAEETMDGPIDVKRYDPLFRLYHYYWWWRPRIVQTDLVHLVSYGHIVSDLTVSAYAGKFPLVCTPGMVDVPIEGPKSAWLKEKYDFLLGVKRLNAARKLILWYENERKWCLERGLPASKLEVLPVGISDESFDSFDPSPVKSELGLVEYILYLGRIHPQRGVKDVVEAFAKIAGDFKGLDLVLAGPDNGALADALERAKRSGVGPRVKYAGTVLGEKKYRLISGCKFVAYPPMKELQGLVLLEAMAQGKPVITSGLDNGLPDYLKNGENGLQIKFGDVDALAEKMKALLSDPGLGNRLGAAGTQTAGAFRWNKLLDRTEAVYRAAIKEGKNT